MITRKELIRRYIDFFKSKGHREIQNSSLIPENDPTVLFTTAGMHPLVPFLLGQKHPLGKRLCNVQRCIRTGDIGCVGDETHHTFFEMLGNWSLGDYWKKEAIEMSFEFLTKVLKIPIENLVVTVFAGDDKAPKDEETRKIWIDLGIKKIVILTDNTNENWWGPAGKTGPCGPDTEIFLWKNKSQTPPKDINLNNENWVEIWNNVFMQYIKDNKGNCNLATQKNIDTGMGVERTITILNKLGDNYLTECFLPIINKIEELSKKKYKQNNKSMRIIADHVKASVFIIADGISPGNKEQGYILRRLIRRAVRYGRNLEIKNFTKEVAEPVFEIYKDYEILKKNKKKIIEELEKEEKKFNETLEKAMTMLNKLTTGKKELDCKDAFLLYQSYGFPVEMIEEECRQRNIKFSRNEFESECKIHQELSRTASAGKFKSGLADNSEQTTKLHTATHLLIEALRRILNDKTIMQKGSNITAERLRIDFNFPRKLTDDELKKIENLVNNQIRCSCIVSKEEMSPEQAKKKGAVGVFDNKYGEKVSVYSIGDFSKEICAGPHVKNTCELGKFKILKEESSSSGVRRIKAVLE